jgi:hypothetical protein
LRVLNEAGRDADRPILPRGVGGRPGLCRGAISKNLRPGHQACTGTPWCSGLGVSRRSSSADADPRVRNLVAACFAWVPVLKFGSADGEDEPSHPVRPRPAVVPLGGVYSFAASLANVLRSRMAHCRRRSVCAAQRCHRCSLCRDRTSAREKRAAAAGRGVGLGLDQTSSGTSRWASISSNSATSMICSRASAVPRARNAAAGFRLASSAARLSNAQLETHRPCS